MALLSTAVDCGALTNPANGQVSHAAGTTFGHTATYSCNIGYNLLGDSTRTCQATEVWSGSAPTCYRMLLLQIEHHKIVKFKRTHLLILNIHSDREGQTTESHKKTQSQDTWQITLGNHRP